MKKLLKVNYKIWILMFGVMAASAVALFFIFRMNIEKTFTTQLTVDNKAIATLAIKDQGAYLIKKNDKISLLVNEHFLDSKIEDIKYDDKTHQYLMTLDEVAKELLPNTTLDVKIIYDQHSVLDALLNPSV